MFFTVGHPVALDEPPAVDWWRIGLDGDAEQAEALADDLWDRLGDFA